MTFRRSEHGGAAIETVLIFPVLIGIAMLGADLYNLHQARSYLEQTAHTVASVIGVQSRLDFNGLQALINGASSMNRPFELIISKVESDRSMTWRPLRRGGVTGICPGRSQGDRFTGTLPEAPRPSEDTAPPNTTSMIVVQVCTRVDDQVMGTALLAGEHIEVQAVSRLQHGTPLLDDALVRELQPVERRP